MTGPRPRRSRQASPAGRAGLPRGQLWFLLATVAALALAGVLTVARDARSELQGVDGPVAYRILYRVENRTDPVTISWEERVVERPFRGHMATFRSRPPTVDPPSSGILTTADSFFVYQQGTLRPIGPRVPATAGGDQLIGVIIDEAVELGLAERLGRRTIAGRRCRVYRVGEPPAGPLLPPAHDSHDDVCIDGDGFVLWERWTLNGDVVLLREAVEVDTSPPRDALADALSPQGAQPLAQSLPVPRVEPATGTESFLPAPPPPDGFRLHGTYRTTAPPAGGGPGSTAGAYASLAWVFTRGPDVVVVEAGEGDPPWTTDQPGSRAVEIAGLGLGVAVLGAEGSEIRLRLGNRRWVHVAGSVEPNGLRRYAEGIPAPAEA